MAKQKSKVVTLEGTTDMTNPDLADYIESVLAYRNRLKREFWDTSGFTLTQRPKVQEVKSPKEVNTRRGANL